MAPSEITVTAWLALLLAGVLEVVWALSLKATDGLTRFWPLMMTLSTIILSFGLFTFSLKAVPFGTAYAVWAGIGAAGSMIAGMVMFGEFRRCIPNCLPYPHHRRHDRVKARLLRPSRGQQEAPLPWLAPERGGRFGVYPLRSWL